MTIKEIKSIEDIEKHLVNAEQVRIFRFIMANESGADLTGRTGFDKQLLLAQSFRDERSEIRFPNGKSGYRLELDDSSSNNHRQPTVVFYFLNNGKTYFRLQEPTAEGKVIRKKGLDTIAGIKASNKIDKDIPTLIKALQIDNRVLTSDKVGRSLLVSPLNAPGVMRFELNRGNTNKVIHGRVHFAK